MIKTNGKIKIVKGNRLVTEKDISLANLTGADIKVMCYNSYETVFFPAHKYLATIDVIVQPGRGMLVQKEVRTKYMSPTGEQARANNLPYTDYYIVSPEVFYMSRNPKFVTHLGWDKRIECYAALLALPNSDPVIVEVMPDGALKIRPKKRPYEVVRTLKGGNGLTKEKLAEKLERMASIFKRDGQYACEFAMEPATAKKLGLKDGEYTPYSHTAREDAVLKKLLPGVEADPLLQMVYRLKDL